MDHIQSRLDKAKSIGAIPINFTRGNAAKQILELEPEGVTRSCDCCGYECLNEDLRPQQNAIINDMVRVTSSQGGLGIIGVYAAQAESLGRPKANKISPIIEFPITEFWTKNLTLGAGIVDPKPLAAKLLALVASGRAKPSFIVTREIIIEEAPEAYKEFDRKKEIKIVIKFPWEREEKLEERFERTHLCCCREHEKYHEKH